MKNGNARVWKRSGKTICWTVWYVIFRLLFPKENFVLLIGILSFFLSYSAQDVRLVKLFPECGERGKLQTFSNGTAWDHLRSCMAIRLFDERIHVYQMSSNLTSLSVIDWQTNPNYAGFRDIKKTLATVHNSFKRNILSASDEGKLTENWTHTPDFRSARKTRRKTAPVCFIHRMCTRQYTSSSSEKNWMKKVFHVIWIRNFFCAAKRWMKARQRRVWKNKGIWIKQRVEVCGLFDELLIKAFGTANVIRKSFKPTIKFKS